MSMLCPFRKAPPLVPGAYWVATSGDDATGDGSRENPWATIAKGASELQPGDTLYVKAGTYLQTETLSISCDGTAEAPILIAAAPGEVVVISGDSNQNGAADLSDVPAGNKYGSLVSVSGDYVTLEDLEVAYAGGRGIQVSASHVTVRSCKVHHTWNVGIYVYGAYATVEDCTVYRAGESNYVRGANGDWAAGIAWGYSKSTAAPGAAPYARILNNTVYNNSGEGILGMKTDYGLLEGNVCWDNWAVHGIDADQCSHTTVQKNLIYWTGDAFWTRRAGGMSGILFSNESAESIYPVGHDNTIVNNIVVGCGDNIRFWDANDPESALINYLIAHNTLVEAAGAGFNIDPGNAAPSGSRICNNLVLQAGGTPIYVYAAAGLTFDHNLWSRTPTAAAQSASDVVDDPELVDPTHAVEAGAVLADWYKLAATSPALAAAASLEGVIDDYFDTARPATPDMGAHERT